MNTTIVVSAYASIQNIPSKIPGHTLNIYHSHYQFCYWWRVVCCCGLEAFWLQMYYVHWAWLMVHTWHKNSHRFLGNDLYCSRSLPRKERVGHQKRMVDKRKRLEWSDRNLCRSMGESTELQIGDSRIVLWSFGSTTLLASFFPSIRGFAPKILNFTLLIQKIPTKFENILPFPAFYHCSNCRSSILDCRYFRRQAIHLLQIFRDFSGNPSWHVADLYKI